MITLTVKCWLPILSHYSHRIPFSPADGSHMCHGRQVTYLLSYGDVRDPVSRSTKSNSLKSPLNDTMLFCVLVWQGRQEKNNLYLSTIILNDLFGLVFYSTTHVLLCYAFLLLYRQDPVIWSGSMYSDPICTITTDHRLTLKIRPVKFFPPWNCLKRSNAFRRCSQ